MVKQLELIEKVNPLLIGEIIRIASLLGKPCLLGQSVGDVNPFGPQNSVQLDPTLEVQFKQIMIVGMARD